MRFNPEINFGHIVTSVTVFGSFVAFWATLNAQITRHELSISYQAENIVEIKQNLRQLTEIQATLMRNQDKLTILVEKKAITKGER